VEEDDDDASFDFLTFLGLAPVAVANVDNRSAKSDISTAEAVCFFVNEQHSQTISIFAKAPISSKKLDQNPAKRHKLWTGEKSRQKEVQED
jgi:hypothetical protein